LDQYKTKRYSTEGLYFRALAIFQINSIFVPSEVKFSDGMTDTSPEHVNFMKLLQHITAVQCLLINCERGGHLHSLSAQIRATIEEIVANYRTVLM
jgi:hypothetical protein